MEPRSLPLQADSLPAEPPGKPSNTGVGSLPFSRGSSSPRNQTRVTCIAGMKIFFISGQLMKHPPTYRAFSFFLSSLFQTLTLSPSATSHVVVRAWWLLLIDHCQFPMAGHCTPHLQGSLLLYKTWNHQCTMYSLAVPGPDMLLMLWVVSDALLPI